MSENCQSIEPWLSALAAGATVLTPGRTLAARVRNAFSDFQRSQGLNSWESPKLATFGVWRRGICLDWLERHHDYRVLMSSPQTQYLWEQVITHHLADDIKHTQPQTFVSGMARAAQQAWNQSLEWGIAEKLDSVYPSKDQTEFKRWRRSFIDLCAQRELVDEFSVFAKLVQSFHDVFQDHANCSLWFLGFEGFTPLQQTLINQLQQAEVETRVCTPLVFGRKPVRYEFDDIEQELTAAAAFAWSKTSASKTAEVGVVLPSLGAEHKLVNRVFSQIFAPAEQKQSGDVTNEQAVFQVAHGERLTTQPVVAAALTTLKFTLSGADAETFTQLILSPFIEGAESEHLARAQWDAAFRKRGYEQLKLRALNKELSSDRSPECPPLLRKIFDRLFDFNSGSTNEGNGKLPGEWVEDFENILKLSGWPGERKLDSAEQRAVDTFSHALGKLIELNLLNQNADANSELVMLRQSLEAVDVKDGVINARVHIMSPQEALGLSFDALWMAGFNDKQWPPVASPNPFLPRKLLEQADAPDGSQSLSHQHYAVLTAGLFASSVETVVSSSRQQEDVDTTPSVLVEHVALIEWPDEILQGTHDSAHELVEEWQDDVGIPLPVSEEPYPGGVSVFKNQSDCAFKAYAINRLFVKPLTQIEPALTALERGNLVHDALRRFWSDVDSREALVAMTDNAVSTLIESCVQQTINSFRGAYAHRLPGQRSSAEQRRLSAALVEWTELERQRKDDFHIHEVEESVTIRVGDLIVKGKIDRVDTNENGFVLIDYKIGQKSRSSWQGERPEEPQLPLYRYAYGDSVCDVAFANLKRDAPKFAMARKPKDGDEDWAQTMQDWNQTLERLAEEFMRGDAVVDPRKPDVCNFCELTSFCRRTELLATSRADDESGDQAEAV